MSGPRRTTLRDIAEELGLSVSTVSLGLRRHPRIPGETTERIRHTAARLGYIPNRRASDLRQSRSSLVAVLISDLSNPVFNEFLQHIEEELTAQGLRVILGVAREDLQRQQDLIQMALEQGVAGIVICPVKGTRRPDLEILLGPLGTQSPVQTVLFSRGLEDVALPQVVNDDRLAGRLAAACLLSRGHRRLCWLGGGQQTSTATHRFRGFLDACSEAESPPPQVRHGPTSRQFGFEAAAAALRGPDPPQGFVCFSDLIAFGVISACHACGRTPGRDISVIGCDDMQEAAFTNPRLTTLRVDKQGIGVAAARRVLQRGGEVGTRVFAPELILRDTVADPDPPTAGPSWRPA